MTKVVNKYKEPYDVYIGRGSKWGNPFVIGKDGTREEVLEKYRKWFLDENHELKYQLDEIRGKTLGCFCKPKACHGDILAEFADQWTFKYTPEFTEKDYEVLRTQLLERGWTYVDGELVPPTDLTNPEDGVN